MNPNHQATLVSQGFSQTPQERLPMLSGEAMSAAQRAVADALIAGPRKAVMGPFIPLLRSPELMDRVGKVGEYLRFDSVLETRIRELAMCLVARHVSNQFEWLMHAPLALKAGVAQSCLDTIAAGQYPQSAAADEAAAVALVTELLQHHGVCDASYAAALGLFGEQGVVELTTLVGYFAMVCWVMNVARTPTQAPTGFGALQAFPA
ncbi:carboxymuconolactone decarboxylase family protein [Polaromonas sp. SM01]|uniref:carboxymuconolactone decarboxylase family protein n=1 Tax=Polaromonas sp. SM01 TaxID=3085630 RepID=UPI0029819D81|nr:carboxymuconolactone decarboxylase family protein [Polaromonas sp. SM01]MDW5440978.1 carboxymuconolactone decarboxylase family protein [Polaromonas sp. SM01]